MVTPKSFSDNLKNNIITTSMLEAALFSVNKRAKNHRNAERECRYSYYYKNAISAESKKEEMYKKKELLLSVLQPICIHKEFAGYEKVRVYDYERDYKKKYFYHFLHGTIVWENSYMDWNLDEEVSFFDYIIPEHPMYRYYLYYVVGNHTFHFPIEKLENYNLPIKEIDTLDTFGMDINELVSMQFVDKLINLIKQNNFTYVKDSESVVPEYLEYHRPEVILQKPEWSEIWEYISVPFTEEAFNLPGNIRDLTADEKTSFHIKQKCKSPNKKMRKQGLTGIIWNPPKVKYPKARLECPQMTIELRNFIEENYKAEMGIKDFVLMLLKSPLREQIQENINSHKSMEIYCEQLQEKANALFEQTHNKINISDLS